MLRTHCQTSGWSLTEQDPFNNVARTTIEAMAAVFGGTQSLHTNALDEAIALPTDFSARIARNTQLFLQEETQITKTVDPWAGSHFIEDLTAQIAEEAWDLMEEVEKIGGMTRAIEEGIPKRRIEEAAAKKQARIDSARDTIVGVNEFVLEDEDELQILEVDNRKVREQQLARLTSVKQGRDAKAVSRILAQLTESAERKSKGESGENLLALAVSASRARATLGEISDALEKAFGRYRAKVQAISGVYSKEIQNDDTFLKAKQRIFHLQIQLKF